MRGRHNVHDFFVELFENVHVLAAKLLREEGIDLDLYLIDEVLFAALCKLAL